MNYQPPQPSQPQQPEPQPPQNEKKGRSSFGAALLGGAVVAVIGAILLLTGAVKSSGGGTTTIQETAAAPIVSKSSDEAEPKDNGDGNTVDDIYKADGDGVAFIESTIPAEPSEETFNPFGEPESSGGGTATGSGIVIDDKGHILTNNHVIEGADKIEVKLGESDHEYTAQVVGTDPASDLALIKVEAPSKELDPLTLGDSSKMEVGDPVVAIGNPFGLDRTVTSGIVSALQRQIQAPNGFSIDNVIQTDAAINPGNSGGPLINDAGEVIGINSQIETGGGNDGNVGIGFAIPINTAKEVIHELETKGSVEHAYMGISGITILPQVAKALNLPVTKGVLVETVENGGPADKAGLEAGSTPATIEGAEITLGGDIITEADGQKITTMEQVAELVGQKNPGDEFTVKYLRDGKEKTATVTLGTRPAKVEEASPQG
ncbi:MAG TPA: trypsin-like peptidase domain-containing protein [Solirubrobacterales bacterium]|nr:trypsin-like peptidase domain-containing protein [Solirubrobacterales bacterium]